MHPPCSKPASSSAWKTPTHASNLSWKLSPPVWTPFPQVVAPSAAMSLHIISVMKVRGQTLTVPCPPPLTPPCTLQASHHVHWGWRGLAPLGLGRFEDYISQIPCPSEGATLSYPGSQGSAWSGAPATHSSHLLVHLSLPGFPLLPCASLTSYECFLEPLPK